MNSRQPELIRIQLARSKTVERYLHLLHLSFALYCLSFAPDMVSRLLLCVVIFLSWMMLLLRHLSCHQSILISWLPDGRWSCRKQPGSTESRLHLVDCLVSHRLTILRFANGKFGRRSFLLLADNCNAETHRRLRVRLKREFTRRPSQAGGSYPGS